MDIDRLQKALAIMNKGGHSGSVFAGYNELFLWPMADAFTEDDVSQLADLGFRMSEDGGFECST